MDYACQVWDPHLIKDQKALEGVQKFATSNWDRGYDELLGIMDLKPLSERRIDMKLGLLFKILHKL